MTKANLRECPFCGGAVTAGYDGSSDWTIYHLEPGECFTLGFWVRATVAQWDADDAAEWNLMAEKWNARTDCARIERHELESNENETRAE